MRKIAHIIHKSPVKNDALQSYVKSENHESIPLLLDCKTGWNCFVAMLERYLDLRFPVEKTLIDYKRNSLLCEAEYVALAAIVLALKPIQFGSEKLCSQDVRLLSAEGVFSFIIEELHEQNSAFSLKLKEALISRLSGRSQKTLIGSVKYMKNGKMHSTESRSSGHRDTNLEALPARSVLLSTEKRFLIRLYNENGDKMFASSDSEGVFHSQTVNPDQSRTATLFKKLKAAIKKETECIPKAAQTSRVISRSIAKE